MRDQISYMLARELRTPLSLVTAPLKEMISNSALPESFLQKVKWPIVNFNLYAGYL